MIYQKSKAPNAATWPCLLFLGVLLVFLFQISPTASPAKEAPPTEPQAFAGPLTLAHFRGEVEGCVDRFAQHSLPVVDSHVHARPFGGKAMHLGALLENLRGSGSLFVNIYGIGQRLPVDHACTYYLDCPGVAVKPSLKSDFHNAQSLLDLERDDLHVVLSMTFADLADPPSVVPRMHLLDEEFPGVFGMMGEVNLKKQALFGNHRPGAELEDIQAWKPFMDQLARWNFPITIHSDLGSDEDPLKYLHLMEFVLTSYPENKIIWPHLGISKELTSLEPEAHVALMDRLLDQHANLYFDLSWRVLYDQLFHEPEIRALYVDLLNRRALRFIPGTDFVAAGNKSLAIYKQEQLVNSAILTEVDDETYRTIGLGQSYFDLFGLDFQAPPVCKKV